MTLGYSTARALFRVIDAAYEKRSIAISSNIHPSGFDELMPKSIATATVDRLLHHAHVLITEGQVAEFSELGLLSAFGAPEPVRYETNTTHHSHFRCRLCLRIFDLVSGLQNPEQITDAGFSVERVDTRAEGICAECNDYDAGLRAGARAISQSGPTEDTLAAPGVATATLDGPLGALLLAATPEGLTRVAFEGHGDFDALRARATSRRGSQAARRHLTDAAAKLRDYFAGNTDRVQWVIDWAFLESSGALALRSTESIPYAGHRSYIDLANVGSARDLGWIMGANPIPIVAPCHRVTRGVEIPTTFVGGSDRRHWLESHETTAKHASPH